MGPINFFQCSTLTYTRKRFSVTCVFWIRSAVDTRHLVLDSVLKAYLRKRKRSGEFYETSAEQGTFRKTPELGSKHMVQSLIS